MKKFLRSLPVKLLLILLTAAFLVLGIASGVGAFALEATRFYDLNEENLKAEMMQELIANEIRIVNSAYRYDDPRILDPNFRYEITDTRGTVLDGNGMGDVRFQEVYHYYCWSEMEETDHGTFRSDFWNLYRNGFVDEGKDYLPENATEHWIITGGYTADPAPRGNLYLLDKGLSLAFGSRPYLTPTALLSLVLFTGGLILLCSVSGRKKDQEEPVLEGVNRIPFDLFLALLIAAGALIVLGMIVVWESQIAIFWLTLLPCLGYGIGILTVWLIASLAARIKYGGFWKRTVIGKLLLLLWKGCIRIWGLLQKIPTVPTVALIGGFLAICNILLGILSQDGLIFLVLFTESVLGFLAALAITVAFASLEKQGKAIAEGDLDRKTDTRLLFGSLKRHGEDLNRIGDGLETAVREKMKSERMKTELITNVSHDIKTPLTSIVNYVDLLSREPGMNETTAEYLQILQRQSARLKKLTDDLVEASKASSGALTVEKVPCDLGVLLEQTVAEYEEKTAEKSLTVLCALPEDPVIVEADGRHLWRIFDNLMNNICKYALPGTRVYLSLNKEGERAVVTFRNISKDPLNIDPEELTERFVRGDRARHGEGSGLGLNIARSLTELQDGKFEIAIDADLFKVSLTFKIHPHQS